MRLKTGLNQHNMILWKSESRAQGKKGQINRNSSPSYKSENETKNDLSTRNRLGMRLARDCTNKESGGLERQLYAIDKMHITNR